MKPKHQRLLFILIGCISLSVAVILLMSSFKNNIVFFYSPTELKQQTAIAGKLVRIGGLVASGSIRKYQDGLKTEFDITDNNISIKVLYEGVLPPMFREGQGTVASGTLNKDGIFIANNLLTKHDENYMPPEVAAALQKTDK